MAIFTLFRQPVLPTGAATLTTSNASQIVVTMGSVTLDLRGIGLTVSNNGISGGTATELYLSDSANGGMQFQFTSLNHNAAVAYSYLRQGGSQFMEYLLNGNDTINGSGLNESLQGYLGSDYINGGAGNDTLDATVAGATDTLVGGLGDDTYNLGSPGTTTIVELPGQGTDTVVTRTSYVLPDNFENATMNFGADFGQLFLRGNSVANRLTGSASFELLEGLAGNDTIDGAAGNDTLDGGAGDDSIQGGSGDDVFIVDSLGDQLADSSGTDTAWSYIENLVLPSFIEYLTLQGVVHNGFGNESANRLVGNAVDNFLSGAGGNDTMLGADGADTLTGGAANDSLLGGNGADWLEGNEGNDTLDGEGGADAMLGGAGDDLYTVNDAGDLINEAPGAGADTVQSALSITLAANVENAVITGSATSNATGNELANRLTGNNAPNVFDGGAGFDTMSGLGGSDIYYVDSFSDVVDDNGTGVGDVDTIYATSSYDLANANDVESLVLLGTGNSSGSGSTVLFNSVTGNTGNNHLLLRNGGTLQGAEGNDVLDGSAANGNNLDGGPGADSMNGGTWWDVYTVDNVGDVVNEPLNGQTNLQDTVQSWISLSLPDRIEVLTLLGTDPLTATSTHGGILNGNAGNNAMSGGAFMYGFGGDDTLTSADASMEGGEGNDTYYATETPARVREEPGAGIDTVISSGSASITLSVNVENLTFLVSASGTGNASANLIIGNAQNNTLNGSTGIDTLQGGLGNDYYMVDNAADAVIEIGGQGTDTVEASGGVSYSLVGTAVEILFMGGVLSPQTSTDAQATGNELLNSIDGNNGNNLIDGGAGADTMAGHAGNDTFIVDNVGDTIIEGAGANTGIDTVRSSVSFTLANNVENLVLRGAAVNATGNLGANSLTGNALGNKLDANNGQDVLRGMAGDDTLIGGEGNDTIDGDAGFDVAQYPSAPGAYVVTRGAGNVTISGAEGTDVLTGVDQASFNGQLVTLNAHLATGTVSLAGSAKEGHVLTVATSGFADGDGLGTGAVSLQWFRDDAEIPGATADWISLAASDIGSIVGVRARFIDGAGNTESLWSVVPTVGAAITVRTGTASAESLLGDADSDRIYGLAGNDTLNGGGGNDTLDGGTGVDTAVLNQANVFITNMARDATGFHLTSPTGTLQLDGIERLQLSDLLFSADTLPGQVAWQAEALLWAGTGFAAPNWLWSQWVNEGDTSADMGALGQAMIDYYSPGLGTAALTQLLYANVMHRAPTQEELNFVLSITGPGKYFDSNGDLAAFAASLPENTDRMAGFTGSFITLDLSYFA